MSDMVETMAKNVNMRRKLTILWSYKRNHPNIDKERPLYDKIVSRSRASELIM